MEPKWYVIQTLTSRENSVKEKILKTYLENSDMVEVLIPQFEVVEMRQGKRAYRKKKLMPGYLMLNMVPNKVMFAEIRKMDGVVGFLGASKIPAPLSESELKNIFDRISTDKKDTKVEITFKVDDRVKITDGPFQNLEGTVLSIDKDDERVTVEVPILGRQTSVVLDVMQVQPNI